MLHNLIKQMSEDGNGGRGKQFVCERCRQPFATKQQLTRHMNKKKPCVCVEALRVAQKRISPYLLHLKVQNVEPTELLKKIQDLVGSENVLSFAFEQHEPKQDQPQPQQSQKPQEQESKEEQIATKPEQIATKPKQIATKPEQIATKPKQIDSTPEKVLMSPAEQQKYVELAQSLRIKHQDTTTKIVLCGTKKEARKWIAEQNKLEAEFTRVLKHLRESGYDTKQIKYRPEPNILSCGGDDDDDDDDEGEHEPIYITIGPPQKDEELNEEPKKEKRRLNIREFFGNKQKPLN